MLITIIGYNERLYAAPSNPELLMIPAIRSSCLWGLLNVYVNKAGNYPAAAATFYFLCLFSN